VTPPTTSLPILTPKHLKASYVAEGELVHIETRATKLYYFPGPVLVLIIMLGIDALAASAVYKWHLVQSYNPFTWLPSGGSYPMYALDAVLLVTLGVLLWILVRYFQWMRTVYAVTSHRLIIQRGIAMRDVDDVPMNQVRGVDVHQTAGQRLLGYGTIRISAEGGGSQAVGNEEWKGIPKPFQVQRAIETVMQNPVMPAQYPTQPTVVYAGPPSYPPSPPAQPPR
jgi:membrane protein YdbS with pleckstrin-like domain